MLIKVKEFINKTIYKEPEYSFLSSLPEEKYPKYLKRIYFCKMKKFLNLENPKDINEKIQWLKLYDNLSIKSTLTDKIAVRNWIKDKIGEKYLKNVYGAWNKPEDIDFDILPNLFMCKTNHACKQNLIIKNKEKLLKNENKYKEFCSIVSDWLNYKFAFCAGFELQYLPIKPMIFAEEYLPDITNLAIYCFNGEPKIVDVYDFTKRITGCFYNLNQEKLDYYHKGIYYYNKGVSDINVMSSIFEEAVSLAKVLSKDFKLVRVDFAESKGKLYFEEMTFTPASGFIEFSNNKYLKIWGEWLKLN